MALSAFDAHCSVFQSKNEALQDNHTPTVLIVSMVLERSGAYKRERTHMPILFPAYTVVSSHMKRRHGLASPSTSNYEESDLSM